MKKYDNKIVFTGPVGAGKTTAIGTISDIPPIVTDATASDMTLNRKRHTTVALDYGVLFLDDNVKVHLYGTPGQERFDFMWEILSMGCIGLILLIDNTRSHPLKDIQFFLTAFKDLLKTAPVVIGITKTDLKDSPTIEMYSEMLAKIGMYSPIFEVNSHNKEDVKSLIMALLFSIDPGLGN